MVGERLNGEVYVVVSFQMAAMSAPVFFGSADPAFGADGVDLDLSPVPSEPESNWARSFQERAPALFHRFAPKDNRGLRHVPFAKAVEADLRAGVINRTLGTDEALRVVTEEKVGDEHVYFTITDLKVEPTRTDFTLTFIARGADDHGYEISRRFSLLCNRGPELFRRAHQIDERARLIIDQFKRGQALFHNATRRVTFQGEVKKYTAYYKYGRTGGAELRGAGYAAAMGLKVPSYVRSTTPHAFWMPAMEGRPLVDLFRESIKQGRDFPLQRYLLGDRDRFLPLFEGLGRAIAVDYLTNSHDLHCENVLLPMQAPVGVLDFEKTGIFGSEVYDMPAKPPIDFAIERIALSLQWLFPLNGMTAYNVSLPEGFLGRLLAGAEAVFAESVERREELASLAASFGGDYFARAIFHGTQAYCRMGYDRFSAIPHYAMRVTGDRFEELIRGRIDSVREIKPGDLIGRLRASPHIAPVYLQEMSAEALRAEAEEE